MVLFRKNPVNSGGGSFAKFVGLLFDQGFFDNSEDWPRREELRAQIASDGNWTRSERLMHLDAEELAEGGIFDALMRNGPKFVSRGASVVQFRQSCNDAGYEIEINHRNFKIYDGSEMQDCWGLASASFFEIANFLLEGNRCGDRAYALYGGNDLHGVLMSSQMFETIVQNTTDARELPYEPSRVPPLFGGPV